MSNDLEIIAVDEDRILVYVPPHRQMITFGAFASGSNDESNDRLFDVPFPGLFFDLAGSGSATYGHHIRAVRLFGIPGESGWSNKSALFHVPLPNTNGNGMFCTIPYADVKAEDTVEERAHAAVDSFLMSRFTYWREPNEACTVAFGKEGNVTPTYLMRNPDSNYPTCEFWEALTLEKMCSFFWGNHACDEPTIKEYKTRWNWPE